MVIDDQPDFIEGVKLILEEEGYEVWTAINGQHALDRLESAFLNRREQGKEKSLPDLILADIMMPVMDGYTFYEKTRENPYLNHIPFVFLTAKTEQNDIQYGKELGAEDYLTKPCQPDDLLASVRGKLKRVKQKRTIAAQFTGDLSKPPAAGVIFIIAILAVILIIIVATVFITLAVAG